ncbi:hypothetical protein CP532_5794 [Ophiocordyceps camponoti-leonardi (nom. inval.)]|nr:hypothetical protein CP532_5794 [Ophiocordyceps camponoti-leonardi (nom. inval.)]
MRSSVYRICAGRRAGYRLRDDGLKYTSRLPGLGLRGLAGSRGSNVRLYSELAHVSGALDTKLPPSMLETSLPRKTPKAEATGDEADSEKAAKALKYNTEKAVYVCMRRLFQGTNKTIRKPKIVQKMIEKHRSDRHVNLLIRKYKMPALSKVTIELLHDGSFESTAKAKARFPDLNDAVFAKTDSEEAATTAEALALEDLDVLESQFSDETDEGARDTTDDEAVIANGTTFTSDILEVTRTSAAKTSSAPAETPAKTSSEVAETAVKASPDAAEMPATPDPVEMPKNVTVPTPVVETGPLEAPGPIEMPTPTPPSPDVIGPPISTFLPIPAQHQLLTYLQQTLEAACFDFCKRTMPDVLEQNKWEYAESVELHRWMDEFQRRKSRFPEPNRTTARPLRQIFVNAADIRHICVHRQPVETWRINDFLSSAEALLSLLGDMVRGDRVAKLRRRIHTVTEEVESSKRASLLETENIMRRIASQRMELELLEKRTNLEMERRAKEAEIRGGNQVLRVVTTSFLTRPERPFDRPPDPSSDRAHELGGADGAEARVEARPAARTEGQVEPRRSDIRVAKEPEVQGATKTEARVGTKPEAQAVTKAATQAVAKPEARVETKPEVNPQTRAGTKSEASPQARIEVKPVTRIEGRREAPIETKPQKPSNNHAREGTASKEDASAIIARIQDKLAKRRSVKAATTTVTGRNGDTASSASATTGMGKAKGSDQGNSPIPPNETVKARAVQAANEVRKEGSQTTTVGHAISQKGIVKQPDQLAKVADYKAVGGTKNEAEARDGASKQEGGESSSKQGGESKSKQENQPSSKQTSEASSKQETEVISKPDSQVRARQEGEPGSEQEAERSNTTEVNKSKGKWWLPSFLTASLFK